MSFVLIVEDHAFVRNQLIRDVTRLVPGTTTDSCGTLAEALTKLTHSAITHVVLDLGLPDSVGLDALSRVKQAAPGVRVAVLSGNTDGKTIDDALALGADEFIEKGTSMQLIDEMLRMFVTSY